MIGEVSAALRVMAAVTRLWGNKTEITGGKVIKTVSGRRVLWFAAVQLARMTAAIVLGFGGTKFLVHTISLQDILLNIERPQNILNTRLVWLCTCLLRPQVVSFWTLL